jgi:hypothetical protein
VEGAEGCFSFSFFFFCFFCFFVFLIALLWSGLRTPRKWQAAGRRSVSLGDRLLLRLRLGLRASSCRSPRPARRGAASGAAQRQQLLQSRLQVWQCGFTLYLPPPGGPRPRSSRSSSSSAAFLPPARSLARGCPRRWRRIGELPAPPTRRAPGSSGRRARPASGAAGRPGPARCSRCCCPAARRRRWRWRWRRRWPLAGSLAPSAARTHVLLTEQNPNYSPAPPPTSATLSHWAAGLFRRNNKTCQSGEGQRDD